MNKSELIDQIRKINRGASREFLSEFSERELNDYVRQLGDLDSQRVVFEPAEVAPPVTALAV